MDNVHECASDAGMLPPYQVYPEYPRTGSVHVIHNTLTEVKVRKEEGSTQGSRRVRRPRLICIPTNRHLNLYEIEIQVPLGNECSGTI